MLFSKALGTRFLHRVLPLALLSLAAFGSIVSKALLSDFHFTLVGVTLLATAAGALLTLLIVWMGNLLNRSEATMLETSHANVRLAAIVESSVDAIVGEDLNGIVTSWNRSAERLYGYSAGEMIGQSITRLIPSERLQEELELLRRVRAGMRVDPFETTRAHKEGKTVDVSITISPVHNADGGVIGISKVARDISDQKLAQAQVQESLKTAESALRELDVQKFALDQHAIVAVTDVRGTITYVNDKFCEISKYSRAELIGQNHRLLNSGHHPPEFFQRMYRTIAAGRVWHEEIKNRAKDGTFYWVDTTIVPRMDAAGKPRQYIAIRADITERKSAEHRLERQAKVLDQAQVFVRDLEGRISLGTKGSERLYGFARSQAVGRVSHELLHTEFPAPLDDINAVLRESGIWEGELTRYHRNGAKLHVDSIWLLQEMEGGGHQVIEANNDITERKRTESELQRQSVELARSNSDLEQFAYAASHDLQEPLRAVSGCVTLLQARYGDQLDERAHEFMRHSVEGAARMQNLIEDLLSYSRVSTRGHELRSVSCAKAVENALGNLSVAIREKNARVEYGALPIVSGDLSQLSLLFQNLIGNALKFSGTETPRIEIAATKAASEWEISVHDNGIGIEPKYFERIFVIFQRLHTRTEYPGTGMGLALCKKIVERHGGRIWVESETGKGATFRFTLSAPTID